MMTVSIFARPIPNRLDLVVSVDAYPGRGPHQTCQATILLQIFLREGIDWNVRPESARPSLVDATEYVSGALVTGRDILRELGLPYIGADGIDMTRSWVAAHSGEVGEGSHFSS
jgi:hypothetical protein